MELIVFFIAGLIVGWGGTTIILQKRKLKETERLSPLGKEYDAYDR